MRILLCVVLFLYRAYARPDGKWPLHCYIQYIAVSGTAISRLHCMLFQMYVLFGACLRRYRSVLLFYPILSYNTSFLFDIKFLTPKDICKKRAIEALEVGVRRGDPSISPRHPNCCRKWSQTATSHRRFRSSLVCFGTLGGVVALGDADRYRWICSFQ